jgi:hypothetical protein
MIQITKVKEPYNFPMTDIPGEIRNQFFEFHTIHKLLYTREGKVYDCLPLNRIKCISKNLHEQGSFLVPIITLFENGSSLPCVSSFRNENDSFEWTDIFLLTSGGLVNIKNESELIKLGYVTNHLIPIALYSPLLADSSNPDKGEPQIKIHDKRIISCPPFHVNHVPDYVFQDQELTETPPFPVDLNKKKFYFNRRNSLRNINGSIIKSFHSLQPMDIDTQKDLISGWQCAKIKSRNGSSYLGMLHYHPSGIIYDVIIFTYGGGWFSILDEPPISFPRKPKFFPAIIELISSYPSSDSFKLDFSKFCLLKSKDLIKHNNEIKLETKPEILN